MLLRCLCKNSQATLSPIFTPEEIHSLREFRTGRVHTHAEQLSKIKNIWSTKRIVMTWGRWNWLLEERWFHTHRLHHINIGFYIAPWFKCIKFFPPLQDGLFFLLLMLLNYASGPCPIVHTFFFSWSGSNSGTRIPRLVFMSTFFIAEVLSSPGCWKVPWCKCCSKMEWSITVLWCRLVTEAELWKTAE